MPLPVEDIKEGHCYATKGKQEKRECYFVKMIMRGVVTYHSWSGNDQQMSVLRSNVAIRVFAETVSKEIPCPEFAK